MISTPFKDQTLHTGDTISVKNTIQEGGKSRVQAYQGILIAIRGRDVNRTITVRHIGPGGIGVERIWPLNAPSIVSIDLVRKPKKVRRSKLYFLREVQGKMATRI